MAISSRLGSQHFLEYLLWNTAMYICVRYYYSICLCHEVRPLGLPLDIKDLVHKSFFKSLSRFLNPNLQKKKTHPCFHYTVPLPITITSIHGIKLLPNLYFKPLFSVTVMRLPPYRCKVVIYCYQIVKVIWTTLHASACLLVVIAT